MNPIPVSSLIRWELPHAYRNSNVVQYAGQIAESARWKYIFGNDGQVVNGKQTDDCNGVIEDFLNLELPGVDHNTRSRFNYSGWCSIKGYDMSKMPQRPGVAVFAGDDKNPEKTIHHVGMLCCKFGPGMFDWLVLQDESEALGFRLTKLLVGNGHFNYWGVMDKYFTYDLDATFDPFHHPEVMAAIACPYPTPTALPSQGTSKSDAVRWVQFQLIIRNYMIDSSGPLKNGIDGCFGSLTRAKLTAYEKAVGSTDANVIAALLGQPITPVMPQPVTYKVVHGDSWAAIAARNHMTRAQLMALNGCNPLTAKPLWLGQVLRVQ